MSRKLVLSLVIVSLLLGLCIVGEANANFSTSPLDITINSPSNNSVTTSQVLLKVTITVFFDTLNTSEHRWIAYSLDGQNNVSITPNYQGVSSSGGYRYSVVTGQATLSGLSDGYHNLAVYAKYDYGNWVNQGTARIKFSVGIPQGLPTPDDTTPIIAINVPSQSQSFEENSIVPYSITITKPIAGFGSLRTIGYTLDKSRTIIAGENLEYAAGPPSSFVFNGSFPAFIPQFMGDSQNITLTGYLPSLLTGGHKMQVFVFYYGPMDKYAQTTVSSISHFSVGNQTIQPPNPIIEPNQPFTITLVIASTVSATVIGIGLLVYFKKYKPQQES